MNALLSMGTVRLCLMLLLGCTLVSCSDNLEEDFYRSDAQTLYTMQTEIFGLINAHRKSVDLPALDDLEVVYQKAEEHTEYMIINDEVSHDLFYEREAYLKSNAGAVSVAENVAFAFSTAQGVVNGWLDSSAHKAIIEGDFTHGSICVKKDADGEIFFTHILVKK